MGIHEHGACIFCVSICGLGFMSAVHPIITTHLKEWRFLCQCRISLHNKSLREK